MDLQCPPPHSAVLLLPDYQCPLQCAHGRPAFAPLLNNGTMFAARSSCTSKREDWLIG